MRLTVAIQMDHVSGIDPDADSTFVLALEAQRRGHSLHHYLPSDLAFRERHLTTRAQSLEVRRAPGGRHATLGELEVIDLAELDVVLMRQDPPFDLAYITATHLLEHIHPETLVVNDPVSVRNAPEKLFATHFPELMPPTLITSRADDINAFRREHREIIVKPLHGNGGAGVFHLRPEDDNLNSLLEMFGRLGREPLMVQRYLPEVRDGDKRIILVDGEAMGAVARMPAAGEARANFHAGGTPRKATLTRRDREICETLGPVLREQGLVFVGIDVIGDWLTEINVTSPTGIQEIDRLDGISIEAAVWDAIERRQAAASGCQRTTDGDSA